MLDYAYSKQYLRRLLVFLTYWGGRRLPTSFYPTSGDTLS